MPTREEIKEALNALCCVANAKDLVKSPTGFDADVDGAMEELSDLGVVIKSARSHWSNCSYGHGRECNCGAQWTVEPLI